MLLGFTSNIISDTRPEAASPGNEDPLKYLSIYPTWLHDNDWTRRVKEKLLGGNFNMVFDSGVDKLTTTGSHQI